MKQMIKTARLTLRQLEMSDSARVMELAGDERVAATTLHVPHPYLPGMAEDWISDCAKAWEEGLRFTYAICDSQSALMIGVCALAYHQQHKTAELAYWIGSAYWNKGMGRRLVGCWWPKPLKPWIYTKYMQPISAAIPPRAA